MTRQASMAVIVFCVSLCGLAGTATWYVDRAGPKAGDGTSWETAFRNIQAGINLATHHDMVIVAEGTYAENIRFNGKNIVLTSTDPLNPEVVSSTIIDGNQTGSVVVFSGSENETCVLSGFTITGGSAEHGGGIYGGDPYGGHTHATIQNNTITGNACMGESSAGGGLVSCDGVIQSNKVALNMAGGSGGGGMAWCNGLIQNNWIYSNSAEWMGGGLLWCDGPIRNNLIAGNSAGHHGAGLNVCQGIIQNNTITGNSAGDWAGGLSGCKGTIQNCIIWGNTALRDVQLYNSAEPDHCCIEGWAGGVGANIGGDPGFVDSLLNDCHLLPDSPCIDAGANYYWFPWPQRDLDGNCRLAGLAVDMGCYEYSSFPDTDGDLLSDADEVADGTDPRTDDSDSDGLRDGLEFLRGSDPLQLTPPGILNVPSDFATIQESLCVSIVNDEIVVAPGTYRENLHFCGPDVILRCSDPGDHNTVESTIIDGGGVGPVVHFTGGESEECVLAGFTIQNGQVFEGGGIHGNGTHAKIQNNTITGNSAEWGGGLWGCNGTIQNNTITGNSAGTGGGLSDCHGLTQNNTIADNSAAHYGGGLYACNGAIRNNTIYGNSAGERGGGLSDCHGAISNCIIWGNSAAGDIQVSWANPTYSCIQNWTGGGEGNISLDPQFVDYAGGDYHLSENSPCIDAGKNEDCMWDAVDLDGNPRVLFGGSTLTVDMGAYEYWDETIDTSPPYASRLSPARDATDVQVNSNIVLHLKDDGHGVDLASIVMTVNGFEVCPVITGTSSDFTLTYDPPSYFDLSQRVTVIVDAQDRCSPAKVMEQLAYSFTTIAVDVISPEITLLGDPTIMLPVGSSFDDPGFIAEDHPDGDISSNVVVTGFVDPDVVGTYTLHYNVSDAAGNPAGEKTRTVKVVSPFGVTSILYGGGAIVVMWDSQPDATYTIWCCSALGSGKWEDKATVVSQGQSANWVDLSPRGVCGFYRIERTD